MKQVVLSLTILMFVVSLAHAVPPQTRVVCKSGSECAYTEPADAVDSITDSAANNRYTILVYPGTYIKPITMKSYVSIVGFDRASTIILGDIGHCSITANTSCYTDSECPSCPSPSCNPPLQHEPCITPTDAISFPNGVTETSFRGLTIGNAKPFRLSSQDENPPTTMTVEDSTVGIFGDSIDCWYDGSSGGGHHITASNVTMNVSSDCIMATKHSRFIGRNLTVFTEADGSSAFIRPGGLTGGWYVDIDGLQHTSTLSSGVDYLFYFAGAIPVSYSGTVLRIRNAVWSVTTTGTVAKTQACINLASAAPVSGTAEFEFTDVDCSLTATDSSQTLYGYTIGNDSDLANYRVHVQGGSISTSGPGTKADVSQAATASGFLFEMGSVRNGGTFVGAGTVSAITYNP